MSRRKRTRPKREKFNAKESIEKNCNLWLVMVIILMVIILISFTIYLSVILYLNYDWLAINPTDATSCVINNLIDTNTLEVDVDSALQKCGMVTKPSNYDYYCDDLYFHILSNECYIKSKDYFVEKCTIYDADDKLTTAQLAKIYKEACFNATNKIIE